MIVTLSERIKFYENIFGKGLLSRDTRNFAVRCPVCNHHNKQKLKLVIRTDNDINHCWTCGWKARSLVPLIKKFGSTSQLQFYIESFRKDLLLVVENEVQKYEVKLPNDYKLLASLLDDKDPDVRATINYLRRRNVDINDLWKYKIGYSNVPGFKRRAIIPSFNRHGELNYYSARSIDNVFPKYENASSHKSLIIFNELNIDWNSRLVLCEGPFDMLKCGDNVVPILGSDLSEQTILFDTIIANSTPVTIALDNDMLYTKTPILVKKFEYYGIDVEVVDVGEGRDPGDLTKAEFVESLKHTRKSSWEDSFSAALKRASNVSLKMHS